MSTPAIPESVSRGRMIEARDVYKAFGRTTIAYGTSLLAFLRLAPAGTAIPQLGRDYYTIMGIGLLIAFGVITLTLPLLRRMTAPSTVRFE